MTLQELEYFVEVAKDLNFTAASDRIHVSQPALSKQIQNLENELGYELFVRSRPNLSLTEAGASMLDKAEWIILLTRSLSQESLTNIRQITAPLCIGYSGHLEYHALLDCVAEMAKRHPKCRMKFIRANIGVLHNNLKNEYYDLIFTPLTGLESEAGIKTMSVISAPLVLAVSDCHRLAERSSVSVKELKNEKFIIFLRRESRVHGDMLVMNCNNAGFSPEIIEEVKDVQHFLLSIASNHGIAIVAENLMDMAPCGISFIPLEDYTEEEIQIGAAWLESNKNPARIAFINVLKDLFP